MTSAATAAASMSMVARVDEWVEFEQLALAPMVAAHFRLEDALGGRTGGIAAQTGGWRLVVRGTVGAGRQPAAFTLRRPVKLRRCLTAFANLGNLASFTR